MKVDFITKIEIDVKIDSSEMIMLNRGGSQKIILSESLQYALHSADEDTVIEFKFRLNPAEQGRHDHIVTSAAQHIKSRDC